MDTIESTQTNSTEIQSQLDALRKEAELDAQNQEKESKKTTDKLKNNNVNEIEVKKAQDRCVDEKSKENSVGNEKNEGLETKAVEIKTDSLEGNLEKDLENTRNAFIIEKIKFRKENSRRIKIEKIKNFLIRKDGEPRKVVKEEKYYSEKYKETEKKYNQARLNLRNKMYADEKSRLEGEKLPTEEINKKLKEYADSDLRVKIFDNEYYEVQQATAENPDWIRKIWKGYVNMKPPWKKRAVSIVLFTTIGAIGNAATVASLAGLAAVRFGKSITIGAATASVSSYGIDWLKKGSDKKFKASQEAKGELLKSEVAETENLTLEGMEKYEKGVDEINKAERKRARDRAILKAGVTMLLGGAIGIATHPHHAIENVKHNNSGITPTHGLATNVAEKLKVSDHHHGVVHHVDKTPGHHEKLIHHTKTEVSEKPNFIKENPQETPQTVPDGVKMDNGLIKTSVDLDKISGQPNFLHDNPQTQPEGLHHLDASRDLSKPSIDQPIKTGDLPKVENLDTNTVATINQNISPTHGIYENTNGPKIETISPTNNNYSGVTEADKIYPTHGVTTAPYSLQFTREVPMTDQELYEHSLKVGSLEHVHHASNIDDIEKDPRHLVDTRQVHEFFGKRDVVVEKPDHDNIDGIKTKDWNTATNNMFDAKGVKFASYEDFNKERELQELFGHSEKSIEYVKDLGQNENVISTTYFRDAPEWQVASKIPAKYFIDNNFDQVHLVDGNDLSQDNINTLVSGGVLHDQASNTGSSVVHHYTYTHHDDLEKLSGVYKKLVPKVEQALANDRPIGNETIEDYVARITKKVFQTDDGTLYGFKNGGTFDGNYTRLIHNTGNISSSGNIYPRYGVWNTGDYYSSGEIARRAVNNIMDQIFRNNRWTH